MLQVEKLKEKIYSEYNSHTVFILWQDGDIKNRHLNTQGYTESTDVYINVVYIQRIYIENRRPQEMFSVDQVQQFLDHIKGDMLHF